MTAAAANVDSETQSRLQLPIRSVPRLCPVSIVSTHRNNTQIRRLKAFGPPRQLKSSIQITLYMNMNSDKIAQVHDQNLR